jgi:hypothetical protein
MLFIRTASAWMTPAASGCIDLLARGGGRHDERFDHDGDPDLDPDPDRKEADRDHD